MSNNVAKGQFKPIFFAFDSFEISPDQAGELQRVAEFRHNSVAIVYYCPRPGSSNPHRLMIHERGKIVFSLEWQNGERLCSSYRPGE